ncbi:MAG: DUF1080 domain-containing protein [Opitutaceae bacterium]|jgi:Domain of Unknown Function (DUF1080)
MLLYCLRGVVILLLGLNRVGADEQRWSPVWNGRDFAGWTTWLAKPHPSVVLPGEARDAKGNYTQPLGSGRDPLGVFTVTVIDGQPAIRISGQVFGELRTIETFSNYHLRLQFKWGQKKWPPRDRAETPRDSGLLYRVHAAPGAEERIWARSTELQIQEHDVGDLYSIGSFVFVRSALRKGTGNAATKAIYDYDPKGAWNVFAQVPGQDGRCVKQPDNEKPTGEWNTVELVCMGEDSIHIVNGKVVMRLHRTLRMDAPTPEPVNQGPLILQSEGAEIFYRGIELRPITAVPVEYAR